MTDPAFGIGDVVQLHSGGAWMTIWNVDTHATEVIYDTVWMNTKNEVQRDRFAEEELRITPKIEVYTHG